MAEALKTAEVEAAQRNKELAAAQKEMDAQRQLGQKQKETEAAQREAMRSAAAVKNDGAPVDEVGASSTPISDAHKKCTDSEGKPVWCTLPGSPPGAGGAQDGGGTAAAGSVIDAAAAEKKCTNEAGEPIWCDGAPPGTEVIDKLVPADDGTLTVAEGEVVGARAMDAGALNQALSRVMSDPMAGDGGEISDAHGEANAGPPATAQEDPLEREAEEEAHPDAARQMLRAK